MAAYWFAKAKLGDDSYARAEATKWVEKSKLGAQRLQSRPLDPNANEATKRGVKLKSRTRINTNEAEFYKKRGDGYNDLGQFKQAIEDYDEAIRIDPYHPRAYRARHNRALARQSLEAIGALKWLFKD